VGFLYRPGGKASGLVMMLMGVHFSEGKTPDATVGSVYRRKLEQEKDGNNRRWKTCSRLTYLYIKWS
jgi:hypothetical protein